jgi:hypothetical protein
MVSSDFSSFSPESLQALGSLLRQTREARGLTLLDASQDTYIRALYLEALEKANLDQLPEPVYVHGFIKRYGDYLGLNGESLLEQSQSFLGSRPLTSSLPEPISLRPIHLWTAYLLVITLAIGGLSAWIDYRENPFARWLNLGFPLKGSSLAQKSLAQKSIWPLLKVDSQQPIQAQDLTSGQESDPVLLQPQSIQLDIRAQDLSWLKVERDGQPVLEKVLQPGEKLNYSAQDLIVLTTGNAGGLLLTFNNKDLGVMGKSGEVKKQSFSRTSSP